MFLRPAHRFHHDLTRRIHALVALAVFLLGTNVCVFAPPPAFGGLAKTTLAESADGAAAHGCCGAATDQAARDAEATRQATAPCCVAVSPVLAAHGASVDPAPVFASVVAVAPLELPIVLPAMERLALAVDVRPPALRAATPDAGRAPPLL
ncbi:MAG: hypothetical protein ABIS67_07395 [Candidatus Eisenbacteria bacterium]